MIQSCVLTICAEMFGNISRYSGVDKYHNSTQPIMTKLSIIMEWFPVKLYQNCKPKRKTKMIWKFICKRNGEPQASNDSERSFNFNERKSHQKIKRYFPGILVIVYSLLLKQN